MAAQAKTTGDLTLFCRLIGFPQCLSSLSSLQPGTRRTFSQGGRETDMCVVSNGVGFGTDA